MFSYKCVDSLSINFLMLLPELWQLLLINIVLIFCLVFSYISRNVPQEVKTFVHDDLHLNTIEKISPAALGLSWRSKGKYISNKYWPFLLIESVIFMIILSLIGSFYNYINVDIDYNVGFETIIWDKLTAFMIIMLCLSAGASLGLGSEALKRFGRYEFVLITWLSLLGMICLIKSYNFLAFYLSIELQSLSFYMLASMRSRTEASAEAGLKYFILSAFSSAILLLGMSLIYGGVGTHNWSDLAVMMRHFELINSESTIVNIGFGCICISLLFKLGAAPFHMWVADVYEGSQTSITAFFAITSKIGVSTLLIRTLCLKALNCPNKLFDLLTFAGALSLIIGSLSALRQIKLKRLLAFSGIANVGWFLLALICGEWLLLIIHLLIYIVLTVTLFGVFLMPLYRTHPYLNYRKRIMNDWSDYGADSFSIKYISDLRQINQINPSLAFALMLALFSLAGIPPLAGFYSKYLIINALIQKEHYGVLLVGLVSAVISAFYYLRVIKTIYFNVDAQFKEKMKWFTFKENGLNASLISICTIFTLMFFIRVDYLWIWLSGMDTIIENYYL